MIDSKDISVVVQGNVEACTVNTLKSIRRFLPDAEIIISTWKDAAYQGLDCDRLVLSDDPLGVTFDLTSKRLNNINRIIVSSQAGIKVATRKYILLIRSDLLMCSDNILKFEDSFKRNEKASLFKKRIFSYEMFSIKFETLDDKKYYSFFHISDWCRFGLAEDIQELYNIKTVKEPDFSQFFLKHSHDKFSDIWPERMWKMSPEQYITSENAKKIYKNLNVQDRLDWSDNILNCSDEFIVNNFIIKSIKEWGIINLKPQYKGANIKKSDMTKNGAWLGENWHRAYKKYCDNKYTLPLKYRWQDNLEIREDIVHLNKHYNKFKSPIKRFLCWSSQLISIISYTMKILISSLVNIHKLFK